MSNIYFYYFIPRPMGQIGNKGSFGDKGDKGDNGDIGESGLSGYRGPYGVKGKDIGLRGVSGRQGIRGLIGNKGDKGFLGLKGDKGDKGPSGIKGQKGYSGKKGLEGPEGFPREISSYDASTKSLTNTSSLDLSADRTKCVQVYAYGNEMKCPENMAVFDIRARKISFKSEDSEIDKIICCRVQIENQHSQSYFNKLSILANLQSELAIMQVDVKSFKNGYIPANKYHPSLKEYNESQRNKILDNIGIILKLTIGILNKKSIREMPLKNLEILLGDTNLAKRIKVYTDDEITKIIDNHESITSYEFYILNLMNGLITIKTTDFKRLVKEVYDFPKNNIEELEEKVNIQVTK